MFKNMLFLTFLLYASFGYSQITPDKITVTTNHVDHDHAYHCNACHTHLFDAAESTIIKNEIHYHEPATDNNSVAFTCAGCSSPLGYLTDNLYQLSNDKVNQKNSVYHCAACQAAVFDAQNLNRSDNSFSYFSTPIEQAIITTNTERRKFYKMEADKEAIQCAVCEINFGKVVQDNDTGGFGVRVNINSVNKKRKN